MARSNNEQEWFDIVEIQEQQENQPTNAILDFETLFPAHNPTPLDRSFLTEVIEGFEVIESGSASLLEYETYYCYNFPRFQVLTLKIKSN